MAVIIWPVVRARMLSSEDRLRLRELPSRPILDKLRDYVLEPRRKPGLDGQAGL